VGDYPTKEKEMAESGVGGLRIFDDFVGFEVPVASTAAQATAPYFTPGGLRVVGQGLEQNDSGVVGLDADGLNGVVQLISSAQAAEHSCGFTTNACFDMTLNGGIMIEARVRFADLDTKEAYFGLTDVVTNGVGILEGEQLTGASTTLTLTASDLCGFYLSAELTDDEDWHGVYNGGTTTGATTSTDVDLDADATAGEFQILKLTVGNDGTARWYVDGVLKQTVTGAVSTSTDLAVLLMVESKTAAVETMDVDYVLIESSRDWTV
jgi:hypothetical protein